jgi:hypothetical protein
MSKAASGDEGNCIDDDEDQDTDSTTENVEDNEYSNFVAVDDDADSSDDEANAAFQSGKTSVTRRFHYEEESESDQLFMRRNTSWQSFLTRSHRNKLKPDFEELQEAPDEKVLDSRERKIRFRLPVREQDIHHLDPVLDKEKVLCYMTDEDFNRGKDEIRLVLKLWEKHKRGQEPLDENVHTLRGLEDVTDGAGIPGYDRRRNPRAKYTYRAIILRHLHHQKMTNEYLNWEKCSALCIDESQKDKKHVLLLGQHDAEQAREAYNPDQKSTLPPFVRIEPSIARNPASSTNTVFYSPGIPRQSQTSRGSRTNSSRTAGSGIDKNKQTKNPMKKVANALSFWNR